MTSSDVALVLKSSKVSSDIDRFRHSNAKSNGVVDSHR